MKVLAALLLISACSSDYLARIHYLEQSVIDNPKGVVDSLSLMKPDFPRMTEKEQAYYSLIYAMALDKSYIDTTDVSILDPAVKYYSKHGSPREKMLTYYYLGRIHENSGDYSEAIISLTKALEQDWDDNAYRGRAYMAIADANNYTFNSLEEARCVDSAAFYYTLTGDSTLIRAARFRKAICLINARDRNTSRAILDELLQHEDLDYYLKRNCLQQDAYVTVLLDDEKRFPQALTYFSESAEMGLGLSGAYAAAYAYLLYRTGNKSDAMSIFNVLNTVDDAFSKAASDSWRSRICFQEGDLTNAFSLLERSLVMVDSTVISSLNQSMIATQRDYYSDKALREEQYTKLLEARQTIMLLSIALIICLLSGIIIIIRRRNMDKVGKYESAMEELKDELLAKTKANVSANEENAGLREHFKRVYKRHFDLLARFYEEYDIMLRNGYSEEKKNKQIQKIIDGLSADKESFSRFETIVDEDMNGILSQFRNDYPGFAEIDYRLFCYYVAGFSTKFIYIIINSMSSNSIYIRKSRMKKVIESSDCPRRERYLEFL